eukprot:8000086-Alexandrium_andersonii.AAC.1
MTSHVASATRSTVCPHTPRPLLCTVVQKFRSSWMSLVHALARPEVATIFARRIPQTARLRSL